MYLRYVCKTTPGERVLHNVRSYIRLRALVQSLRIEGEVRVSVYSISTCETGAGIEIVRIGTYEFRLLLRDPERSLQYTCTVRAEDDAWRPAVFASKLQGLMTSADARKKAPAAVTEHEPIPTQTRPVQSVTPQKRHPPPVTAQEVARGFEVDRRLRALLRRP